MKLASRKSVWAPRLRLAVVALSLTKTLMTLCLQRGSANAKHEVQLSSDCVLDDIVCTQLVAVPILGTAQSWRRRHRVQKLHALDNLASPLAIFLPGRLVGTRKMQQ